MSFVIDDVLIRHDPQSGHVPVVFDSPHSGRIYPANFDYICPADLLRQAEDSYVDELFASAPDQGAVLLCALFPRSFIDVNRAQDDIDPDMLDGPWPGLLSPSEKSMLGMGLIRSLCRPGMPMYQGRLPVARALERVERYWRPYHEQLAGLLDALHARFGAVWHVNCHSMPTIPGVMDDRGNGPDFVLGDRDGTTCEAAFTRFVADTLRDMGYRVKLNDPYKGVELVRRYSRPTRGRHSLQIEVHRRLYMNEETLERHSGFERLRQDIDRLIGAIAGYAADRCRRQAAE